VVTKVSSKTNYPSKIVCPNTTKIVHRERLFEELDTAQKNTNIIWIAAPGGSGKTTLISSYIERRKISHCWYEVDEDDEDLATFFHYLGLAAKKAAPRRKKAILKLTPEYQHGINAFTHQFFTDLSSRLKHDGLIVLDNFNVLSDSSEITSLIPHIIESLEPTVSLLIISRHLPPQTLNPLLIKRQLFLIDTKKIQFTNDEWLAAGQLFNSTQSKNTLLATREKLDGWIAGLILLPNMVDGFANTNTSNLGIEVLDSYIAEQFLTSLDAKTNELLMSICYMPRITASSAIAVSNIADSKKLLATLAQKNLFVIRQGELGYTLHPLVKEYLQHRAIEKFSTEQLHDLRYKTAKALLDDGEYEAAADLLLELKEWKALVTTIIQHVDELFNSGRIESLQRYISTLPDEFTNDEPWIIFWKGKLSTYIDVISALDLFEKSYMEFMAKSDAKGAYLTWYTAVSVICSSLRGGDRLSAWITRYDDLCDRYPEPPKELAIDVIDAKLLHCYFCSDQDPIKREELRTRLLLTIETMADSPIRLQLMSTYAIVAATSGVREQDMVIFKRLENSLSELQDDPLLYLSTALYSSIGLWSLSAFDQQLVLLQQALELAKESGVSIYNGHIQSHIVIAALGLGNNELAKKYIDQLKASIGGKDLIFQSRYMTSIIIAGTTMDEYKDLDSTAMNCLNNIDDIQIPPFIINNKLLYIYYLCERNKLDTALSLHDDLLKYCESLAYCGQLARFYLTYAKLFFNNNKHDRSNQYLLKGFTITRKDEIFACAHWPPQLMTWACQRALELNIETSYVLRFIEKNYENLSTPSANSQTWPWPFRISTFGHFHIESKNIPADKKPSSKTYALLKALVTSKNASTTHYAIKEKLYDDYTNDKASQLFDTQIHRIRKHFGNEQSILRQGDNIKLNLKYFWIDAIEFENIANRPVNSENALEVASRLQELYQGEYFPEDDSLEIMAQRERYRNKYLATLFKCIEQMPKNSDITMTICQNALVLEPLSEPLYRKLITCYLAQGNRDMAEITLSQCRKLIKLQLDTDVSNETKSLLD